VSVGAIVLAAGEGRRFGGTKQLAPLHGRPLLEHALAAVTGLEPRVVVLGHAAEEILAAVDLQDARPVLCGDWGEGQSASVRTGIAALGDVDAALLVLGDQPRITRAAVDAVAAADLDGFDAARASYGGRPGHPVLLGRGLLDRAGELTGDAGFRDLLAGARIRDVEVGTLADPVDVDTPEALERVEGICGGDAPPLVGATLTGTGLTLDQAVAALERGEWPLLTDLQRRMVEEHAAR
jgi:molybdenum cofactor cytidylyltransferase